MFSVCYNNQSKFTGSLYQCLLYLQHLSPLGTVLSMILAGYTIRKAVKDATRD